MGSWLEGGPSGGSRGARAGLGLPASGPGSLAPLSRRVVAVAIDWALCLAISGGFFGADPLATLAVFAVENVLLVGTIGSTVGHRLLGMLVRPAPAAGGPATAGPAAGPAKGAAPGIVRAAVRTVLLCLVIPAVVWDAEGRSLHDRAAGTVLVRRCAHVRRRGARRTRWGQRPRMPLRSGRARVGSMPLGTGSRAAPSAVSRLMTSDVSCLVRVGLSFCTVRGSLRSGT